MIAHLQSLAIASAVAALASLSPSVAWAQGRLVGIANNGSLYDVNPATGAASNPRVAGGFLGIATSPGGTLFGLRGTTSDSSLQTINPSTGAATVVGNIGRTTLAEGDLAFDPTSGLLYGMQDVANSTRTLFTLNPATGAATDVGNVTLFGSTVFGDFSAMAFTAAGGLLLLDTLNDRLYPVNKATAVASTPLVLSANIGTTAGMTFDRDTGTLYVIDSNLYKLDPTTGTASLIGPAGVAGAFAGLAFVAPEPATIGAIAALGAGVLIRRRRR